MYKFISTHTLTWSVTTTSNWPTAANTISTHTLTWSVTYVRLDTAKIDSSISTHTLTWSVTRSSTVISYCNSNFNSHAHVERDPPMQRIVWMITISTHTLTWSVTFDTLEEATKAAKFQLTRSRGAWLTVEFSITSLSNFNSHAHVERDSARFSPFVPVLKISTHTLTWSVTHSCKDTLSTFSISTHTLTWSVTLDTLEKSAKTEFQLTRSRGAWRYQHKGIKYPSYFNSHAHVERDNILLFPAHTLHISTHTLTWSVTFCKWFNKWAIKFQLTRSRGAWLKNCVATCGKKIFQLTRSRGAWRRCVN